MYPSIVLLTDMSHKQNNFSQKRKMVARVCNDFKPNQKTIEGLKVIEESLRRANKYDVQARNQMLWIWKSFRQIVSLIFHHEFKNSFNNNLITYKKFGLLS